jgi:hypothetical protein
MLSKDKLSSNLRNFFNSPSIDTYSQATKLSHAIHNYYMDAQDTLGNNMIVPPIEALLITQVFSLFTTALMTQTAQYFSTQLGVILESYMLSPVFGGPKTPSPAGIWTSTVTTSVVPSNFLSIFYTPYTDIEPKLSQFVDAIDNMSKSTLLTMSYVIPGAPPIPMVTTLSIK